MKRSSEQFEDDVQSENVPPEALDISPKEGKSAASLKSWLQTYSHDSNSRSSRSRSKVKHESAAKSDVSIPVKDGAQPQGRSSRTRVATSKADTSSAPVAKKRKTTTKERAAGDPYNPENNLVDSLRPGLRLVMIGLNPGITTAKTGHAYAHPSNLFWKLLHWSGVTSARHLPAETHDLLDLYSIGNTNICQRSTRSGDGLSKDELIAGAGTLEAKIRKMRPEAVCIVGKGIWDTIYKVKTGSTLKAKDFHYGWQEEKLWLGRTTERGKVSWAGSRTFVATTTSGLAASMSTEEKLEIWKPLGEWMQSKRDGPEDPEITERDKVKEEA